MKKEKDIIGDIFNQKLHDLSIKPDKGQWVALSKEMERKKFFRLGFGYFNIYYLGLIVLTPLAIITFYFYTTPNEEKVKSGKNTFYNTPIENSSIRDTNKTASDSDQAIRINKEVQPDFPVIKRKQASKDSIPDHKTPFIKPFIQTDTSRKDSLTKNIQPIPQDKKINTVPKQIHRRDTIIEIDTVKVKKRRKAKR